ncbi:hypothetical protein F8388_007462 [Cannabis sativa]|uniref:Uncharacterized protein n=1 Tax=Cannabis sativa TaxID=3483 RepID=A0A7J6F6Y9_CANSA|nr:hypothetical protein F8388_007462 [Cannabis sativa]
MAPSRIRHYYNISPYDNCEEITDVKQGYPCFKIYLFVKYTIDITSSDVFTYNVQLPFVTLLYSYYNIIAKEAIDDMLRNQANLPSYYFILSYKIIDYCRQMLTHHNCNNNLSLKVDI